MSTTVTFPTIEAAISALCERVLGAPCVIEPEYRMLEAGETIEEGDECFVAGCGWQDADFATGHGMTQHSTGRYRRPLKP